MIFESIPDNGGLAVFCTEFFTWTSLRSHHGRLGWRWSEGVAWTSRTSRSWRSDEGPGRAAVMLCRFWPAKFGDFPVDNAKTIVDLCNGAGNLWKKIQELAKGRPGGSPFCWKRMGVRELLSVLQLDHQMHLNATEVSMQSECDMEFLGKCYGSCPAGMKSAAFVGQLLACVFNPCVQI